MVNIFEVTDKSKRKIRLTKEKWSHIRKKHPEVAEWDFIKETLQKPDKIVEDDIKESVKYFYKFYKNFKKPNRYLCVIINYLNGGGYVLTAYTTKNIKW